MSKGTKLTIQFGCALALMLFISGALFQLGSHVASHFTCRVVVEWPNERAREMRAKTERDRPAGVAALYSGPHEIIFTTPDGRQIECGLRSDGVVVWRERKK